MHSENSFLAGSEKGCEKVKKPQWRIKTEPDGVEMQEESLEKKEKQRYLPVERERAKINLVAVFLLPGYVSGKPDELSMSNNECVL